MSPEIRAATRADAPAIKAIYDWFVENTTITFEVEPVPLAEMERRIEAVQEAHDWLVLEEARSVLGYSYAARYHARAAYRFSAETTIYLRHDLGGRGLGTRLYAELVRRCFARGYRQLVGGIALPNEPSVRLHERLGFAPVGRLPRIGWKHGRWIDVGYWQLAAPSVDAESPPPGCASAAGS